jgi:hypothetical protein
MRTPCRASAASRRSSAPSRKPVTEAPAQTISQSSEAACAQPRSGASVTPFEAATGVSCGVRWCQL